MRSKITLELSLCPRLAKVLYDALYPDNINLPRGLHIEMLQEGSRLTVSLVSEFRFETLISTVEEMLDDIHSALTSIDVVKTDA